MHDRRVKLMLLGLSIVYALVVVARTVVELAGAQGLLFADGTPIGGDFINMWSAARMVLEGVSSDVYRVDAFVAYEVAKTGAPIGFRVWAYPAHSLLFVWPLGWMGFFEGLALWSAVGLAVLGWGARRIGLGWIETAIILLSPASLASVYYGQTGNFACGLFLLALSARRQGDGISIAAALLLTIKPQTGFLLPVLWAVHRKWRLILTVGVLVALTLALSLAVMGTGIWQSYLGDTLVQLDRLERNGSGPFMLMLPTAFMAFRIVTGDGDMAATLHLVFAVCVFVYVLWRLLRIDNPVAQNALLLVAATLVSPYLHHYDLSMLLAGVFLIQRPEADQWPLALIVGLIVAWALPTLTMAMNALGVPLSPLLILPLLLVAGGTVPLKRM